MPRYKLRTLLILLAIMPPLLWFGWTEYEAWKAERERQRALREASQQAFSFYFGVSIDTDGTSAPLVIDLPTISSRPQKREVDPVPVTVPDEPN